jgi:NAD(P)-dependent dehydrogenase (short-subunit alcohol dehydrogenase family)
MVIFADLQKKLMLRHAGAAGVLTVTADVSTEEGNKAMIDAAMAEFGEVHGLFANAGASPSPPPQRLRLGRVFLYLK